MKRFRGLGLRQEEALRQIAFGHDGAGIHRGTLAALEVKGLIVGYDDAIYGMGDSPIDRIPVMVRRYSVPLPIHAEYCAWCSKVCECDVVGLPAGRAPQ